MMRERLYLEKRRERLRRKERNEEVWGCMCVGVAPANDASRTVLSDSCSAQYL